MPGTLAATAASRSDDEYGPSLSHDPSLRGRPNAFRLPVRDAPLFAGAGFVTVYCGAVQTMPRMPDHPAAERIELRAPGAIIGL